MNLGRATLPGGAAPRLIRALPEETTMMRLPVPALLGGLALALAGLPDASCEGVSPLFVFNNTNCIYL